MRNLAVKTANLKVVDVTLRIGVVITKKRFAL